MKVSVCITTYNHEPYIAQALDSVLMQDTDFDYEILLGEDDSSDGTREICREYARQHPDRIRLFLNDRKNVIYINGRPTGRWNFMNNLSHARGEYVALLEGDDYWTDPHKLRKQVTLMDLRKDVVVTGHGYSVVDREGNLIGLGHSTPASWTLFNFVCGCWFKTCTTVWRRSAVPSMPQWMYQILNADTGLHALCLKEGNAAFIEDVMAAYRQHPGGIWSAASERQKVADSIHTWQVLRKHLGWQSLLACTIRLRNLYLARARHLHIDGSWFWGTLWWIRGGSLTAVIYLLKCIDSAKGTVLRSLQRWAPSFYANLRNRFRKVFNPAQGQKTKPWHPENSVGRGNSVR